MMRRENRIVSGVDIVALVASFDIGKSRRGLLWLAFATTLLAGLWAGAAQAQSTYSYAGVPYSTLTDFSTCEAGDCENYSPGQSVSGSFQTASPLAANLSSANVASLVTAFSFTDGLTNYSSIDPQAYVFQLDVSTNASGAITSAVAIVLRHQTMMLALPPGSAPYTDPNTKIDSLAVQAAGTTFGRHNVTCSTAGTAPSGRTNSCLTVKIPDNGLSSATSATAAQWVSPAPPVAVAAVPTMSEWAMILLGLVLAGGAAIHIQRRQTAV